MNLHQKPLAVGRSVNAMASFLAKHFRYDTMSSWNRGHSYANCIKVSHLGLNHEEQDACYNMLDAEHAWRDCGASGVIRRFDADHSFEWQIGTNGRSGGYLVLYQGGRRLSDYKSYCPECGQRNATTFLQPGETSDDPRANGKGCGVCHHPVRINASLYDIYTQPGLGTDMGMKHDDFVDKGSCFLRDRVRLVHDFDVACWRACKRFLDYAMSHVVEDETIMVPRQIKTAVKK